MTAPTFADRLAWSRVAYRAGRAGVLLGDDATDAALASHSLGMRDAFRSQRWDVMPKPVNKTDGRDRSFTVTDYRMEPCPTTGCWLWSRSVDRGGYGRTLSGGKSQSVHRIAWVVARGSIPDGMFLDHTCRVRSCCNPDHLRVVTPRENAIYNSRSSCAAFAARTHCTKCGQALSSGVTVKAGSRTRRCAGCHRLGNRLWWQRNRGKRPGTYGIAAPTPAALRAVAIEEGRHAPLGYVPPREGAS